MNNIIFAVFLNESDGYTYSCETLIGLCLTQEDAETKLLEYVEEQGRKRNLYDEVLARRNSLAAELRETLAEIKPLGDHLRRDKQRYRAHQKSQQQQEEAAGKKRASLKPELDALGEMMRSLDSTDPDIASYEIRPVEIGKLGL